MAVKVLTGKFKKLEESELSAMKFAQLGVYIGGADGAFCPLSNLYEYNEKNYKQITSLKQFLKALKNHTLRKRDGSLAYPAVDITAGEISFAKDARKIKVDPKNVVESSGGKVVFYTNYQIDFKDEGNYISDNYLTETEMADKSIRKTVKLGLNRALKYKPVADLGAVDDKSVYAFVKLAGKSKFELVPISSLKKSDKGAILPLTLDDIKNIESNKVNLFLDDGHFTTIEEIYTEKFYSFTEVDATAKAEIDVKNGTITDLVLDDEGKVQKKTVKIRDYATYNYVQDDKNKQVDYKTYKRNGLGNGNYIKVKIKNETEESMVPISCLFEKQNGEKQIKNLDKFIGKSVFVKDARGHYLETEPLTVLQTSITYDSQQYMQRSEKAEVCGENTYLKLENGKYCKEADAIKPIAYKFIEDDSSPIDAYLVTLNKGSSKERTIVVNKNIFGTVGKEADQAQINYNGTFFTIYKASAVGLVRTSVKNADVVQTSSKGEFAEGCEVLSKLPNMKARREKLDAISSEVVEKYKRGEYSLNVNGKILLDINGKMVEISKNEMARYVLANGTIQRDFADEQGDYQFLKENSIYWDGNILKGGPTYLAKNALKKDYSNIGTMAFNTLMFSVGFGGILAAMISPWIVGSVALGIAGLAVGMPIFRMIRKGIVEGKFKKYKDKLSLQRKATKDEIYKELYNIVADVRQDLDNKKLEKSLAKAYDDEEKKEITESAKRRLLNRFAELEEKLSTLSVSVSGATFTMENGRGEVNEDNVHLFYKYKEEIEALKAEIKAYKRKKTLTVQEENELKLKEDKLEEMKKNYVKRGEEVGADPEYDKIAADIALAKSILLLKSFGAGDKELDGKTLSEADKKELKALIDSLDLDVAEHSHTCKKIETRKFKKLMKESHLKTEDVKAILDTSLKDCSTSTKEIEIEEVAAPKLGHRPAPIIGPVKPKSPAQLRNEKLAAMTNAQIEDIIKQVAKAMEKLRVIGADAYGKNDLSEANEIEAEKLKKVYEDNKYVLKYLVDHKDYVQYSALFNRYALTINTIGLTYKEFKSIVENVSSKKL